MCKSCNEDSSVSDGISNEQDTYPLIFAERHLVSSVDVEKNCIIIRGCLPEGGLRVEIVQPEKVLDDKFSVVSKHCISFEPGALREGIEITVLWYPVDRPVPLDVGYTLLEKTHLFSDLQLRAAHMGLTLERGKSWMYFSFKHSGRPVYRTESLDNVHFFMDGWKVAHLCKENFNSF